MEQFLIGQITLFGGNFAPEFWVPCDGRLLPIEKYPSLYAIVMNQFGGDGVTTFAVPDLRSSVPVGPGRGTGLPSVAIGAQSVVQAGDGESQMGTLGINYIMCVQGLFPSRPS